MRYATQSRKPKRRWLLRIVSVLFVGALLVIGATIGVRYVYHKNLEPVDANTTARLITVKEGATVEDIANQLQDKKLIRSAWAFRLYVSSKEVRSALQAGSYELASSQSIPEIVSQLTRGKVATNLVTILPGQRLDQVRKRLAQEGFTESTINNALDPARYAGHPALVDKPDSASLEGYLYPDSYQKDASTDPGVIISASLDQMNKHLTPDMRSAFAAQGLSTYQAIILASIVEREVSSQEDRNQVAQVFLKRLKIGMMLQSDATASYGAVLAGEAPSSGYSSPYNTYQNKGLPPTPISNMTISSLNAVAKPAATDWTYFVSGDDGRTHFSTSLAEHEANVSRYCTKLCN